MPVNTTVRYPDTDTELLQQLVNMLASPDPQSYVMPDYIGAPPFLDTKTQLLYELFLQLQSGGTGGGTRYEHWRYYEVLSVKAPGDDWEGFCEDFPLQLSTLTGATFGPFATGVRINLQISVGGSNDIANSTVLQIAGWVELEEGEYRWRAVAPSAVANFPDLSVSSLFGLGLVVINTDFSDVYISQQLASQIRIWYDTNQSVFLNNERVRLRWGVELQPPPALQSR